MTFAGPNKQCSLSTSFFTSACLAFFHWHYISSAIVQTVPSQTDVTSTAFVAHLKVKRKKHHITHICWIDMGSHSHNKDVEVVILILWWIKSALPAWHCFHIKICSWKIKYKAASFPNVYFTLIPWKLSRLTVWSWFQILNLYLEAVQCSLMEWQRLEIQNKQTDIYTATQSFQVNSSMYIL